MKTGDRVGPDGEGVNGRGGHVGEEGPYHTQNRGGCNNHNVFPLPLELKDDGLQLCNEITVGLARGARVPRVEVEVRRAQRPCEVRVLGLHCLPGRVCERTRVEGLQALPHNGFFR
eukprot:GCRY01009422.1.p1 GENE.GCRY01009422.1~~GCRY01009422.1.p1  ORF type:complete len:116 (-),score=11.29 GCRY01009422.1:88-435(-)